MMSPLAALCLDIAALATAAAYAAPLDASSFLQAWAGQPPEYVSDPSYTADMLRRVQEESAMVPPPHKVGYRVFDAGTQGGFADLPPPAALGGQIPTMDAQADPAAAYPPASPGEDAPSMDPQSDLADPFPPAAPGDAMPGMDAQTDLAGPPLPAASGDAMPGMDAQTDLASPPLPAASGDATPGMDAQIDVANPPLPAASGGQAPGVDAQVDLASPPPPAASGDQATSGDAQIDLASAPPPDGLGDGDPGADMPVDLGEYNVTEWRLAGPATAQSLAGPPVPKAFDSQNLTSNKNNLCMFDHYVPEFILIGVMKAATTTFAADMRLSNSILFPYGCFSKEKGEGFCERGTGKEAHFFDTNRHLGVKGMALRFPRCQQAKRMVATDESPRYLVDPAVPATISSWYGEDKVRLKFMILLRDPIERFHSDYYHAKDGNWCYDYQSMDFATIVHRITHGHWDEYTGGQYGCHQRLEASLYPTSIKRWFAIFAPSQFTIAPFKYVVDPGHEGRAGVSLAETVWNRLGVIPGPSRMDTHINKRSHSSLADDITADQYNMLKSMIWVHNSPMHLAKLLSRHSGCILHGYNNLFSDAAKIEKWLVSNW